MRLLLSLLGLFASTWPLAHAVLLPADDPFYSPPAGFASEEPGTILKSRTVSVALLSFVPDLVEAHQLLYRTTAVDGSAIATVTTVFKPILGAKTDRFISFHTAYDSSSNICDPSYDYQFASIPTDIITSLEQLILQAFLLSGYIVSSADYEGPEAAFSAGRLEGMASLDSMRAVSNFASTLGLSTDSPMVVGYGYSGGAIATGWAASLQPTYAPDLNIVGWASGGTPSNLTGTSVFVDGTVFAGFLPAAIDGLAKPSAYGDLVNPIIEKYVTAKGKEDLAYADENCAPSDIVDLAYVEVLSTDFNTLGYDILYEPTFRYVVYDQNTMGLYANETPTKPVYMYHAKQDEIIPYDDASTTASTWCADGASVEFVTVASGGHATTDVVGFIGVFEFVEKAFAGTVASGCSASTIADATIDPLALGLDLEPILVELLNALGTFGTDDSILKISPSILKTTLHT
ncbi:LIP-domain-containing protein [Teratosphaeria nubilosa]|uniref:LIP-domain-containing protein n=1 Tax=Teratosphaeria nubilosa TaxID=161662 RepID=A0A6G1L095_9PEZI|nr:LIP-domain-containing protein [Teratosphaeria nubilosa]